LNENIDNPFILKNIDKSKINYVYKDINDKKVVIAVYAFIDPTILKVSQYQPRIIYDLGTLTNSIKQEGIKNEIKTIEKENGEIIIIDGARRTEVAINLKIKEVAIIIKKMTEKEEQESIVINNIQHKDFTPIEIAKALLMYKDKWGVSNVELGKKFFPHLSQKDSSSDESGIITSASQNVGRYLKLLELPNEVQNMINKGYPMTKGYYLSLLKFDSDESKHPNWKKRREEYQIELAQSGIPIVMIKKRVKSLVDDEKKLRDEVVKEIETKKNLLHDYNKDLITTITDFLEYIKIDFPIPNDHTEFSFNTLKNERNLLISNLQLNHVDNEVILNKKKVIEALKQLIFLFPSEEYLKEFFEINNLKKIHLKIETILQAQKSNNKKIENEISNINIKWDKVSKIYNKLQKFLLEIDNKNILKANSNTVSRKINDVFST
jgi:ParB/RepB/Spo0J family partition protein